MTLRKKCAIELAVHDVGHPILHCYSFDTKITIIIAQQTRHLIVHLSE